MTGKVRQKIKDKLNNDKKQLRQNWEGYHLLEFATTIRPVKQDTKRRKELDDFLDRNGIGGFEALQKLPSDNSAFTTEKSEGVFESLAAFLDIPTFVCFLNFLEFCRNSEPRRPLDVFDGENKISIEIDDERKVVTLDNAIDGFKKHTKAAEEEFRRKSSQNKSEHSDPIQPRLATPEAKEGNKNYYANAALEVIGRDEQKKRLSAFLEYDKKVAWFQLAGEAGQGKSRLAFDLMYEAKDLGWCAGFLWENNIKLFKDHCQDWQPDKPHLLIFDYVIGREQVIKPIIQTLISKQNQFQHKIRILLVERQRWDQGNQINMRSQGNEDALGLSGYKASWYRNLCEDSEYRDSDLPCRFEDGIEEIMELDKDDLVTIVKQLFSGAKLTISDDALKETLERIDGSGRPLYAYLLAQQLSETQEGYQNWTKIDLLNKQLERDKRRWEKAFWKDDKKAAPTWGDDHPAMKLAVLATMVRGVEFQDKRLKEYFGNIYSSIRREAVAITSGNLVNDDIRPQTIGALEPDLLGTWFVLYCFYNDLEYEELLDIAWRHWPNEMAVFLARITEDFLDLPKEYKRLGLTEKLLSYKLFHENHYLALANVAVAISHNLYLKTLKIPQNIIAALEHAVIFSNTAAMIYLGIL